MRPWASSRSQSTAKRAVTRWISDLGARAPAGSRTWTKSSDVVLPAMAALETRSPAGWSRPAIAFAPSVWISRPPGVRTWTRVTGDLAPAGVG
jgi:hypothetical protein